MDDECEIPSQLETINPFEKREFLNYLFYESEYRKLSGHKDKELPDMIKEITESLYFYKNSDSNYIRLKTPGIEHLASSVPCMFTKACDSYDSHNGPCTGCNLSLRPDDNDTEVYYNLTVQRMHGDVCVSNIRLKQR